MVTGLPPEILLIANGNYHRDPSIRWMDLGLVKDELFDPLRDEVERITEHLPPSHVSDPEHVTNWTKPEGEVQQWSLFNRSGLTNDTSSDFDYDNLDSKRTPKGLFPALRGLADSIPDLVNLRLNRLGPGASLSPHEEHLPRKLSGGQVGLRVRFHIPIQTNDEAWMLADNRKAHFRQRSLCLFNNGCVHGAWNTHPTQWRSHLVFDCLLTKRLYETFLDQAYRHAYKSPVNWLNYDDPWITYEEHVVEEWEPSVGMPVDEFDSRTLTWHPPSSKDAQ